MRTLSPTEKGTSLASLNAVFKPIVTSWVLESYVIVLIPIPFTLPVGMSVGGVLYIPFVFFKIVTCWSPIWYSKSTSFTCLPVNPSRTNKLGAMV